MLIGKLHSGGGCDLEVKQFEGSRSILNSLKISRFYGYIFPFYRGSLYSGMLFGCLVRQGVLPGNKKVLLVSKI